ncbi:hypothetical protein ARMSODRAFT_1033678 [Armillaria solidipes]|uniref:Integral membrane protein n=1 Tax=Armillaria solidipes TaxID=1076256 RepID=A0A2H3BJ16_9AGAR|nr:hypothetical protein ARMSODRAFT_1033678 [Armillaria solidipes]
MTHYLVLLASPMVTQTDIPSDLTDDTKASIFQYLDAWLNSEILYALLHGIYTGILAVTLWNIFVNKCWTIRRALVVVIILLHALITIDFAGSWSWTRFAFIKNGQNFWNVYLNLDVSPPAAYWVMEIAVSISTILADSYIIWCCWMVWGRRWLVVLFPIFSLVSAVASKAMGVYYSYIVELRLANVTVILSVSFVLATTLSCTLLIIYRIVAVAGVTHGSVGRLGIFRHFIEVLVESSAFYSLSLILYLAFAIRGDFRVYYLENIAAIAKGVTPTLLVGRAAAGHTRPREDSDGSTHDKFPT